MPEAKILTVSDGVASGVRQDLSGLAVEELLINNDFVVIERRICEDGRDVVASNLLELAKDFHGLIVTTGGTGFSKRDQTPEGTALVIEREAPGFSEYMRAANPLGMLSRGKSGIYRSSLILNTPGSPKGATENLQAVVNHLGHALALLEDPANPHPTTP